MNTFLKGVVFQERGGGIVDFKKSQVILEPSQLRAGIQCIEMVRVNKGLGVENLQNFEILLWILN